MVKCFEFTREDMEYSVSHISNLIKKNVETNFAQVRVRGEISGFKVAPSGHVYFSLKDENALISAIIWRGTYQYMQVKPEEGMEVVCFGDITTYAGQSKYQLIVQSVSLSGIGALMALFEKRKKQFYEEGLFRDEHKKPLPFLPNQIGIITSITGSVIKDIIHRLQDRFPTNVIIWPVLVQGDKSATEVSYAIKGFNEMLCPPDLLIIARGGGAIEDLWSFNEEVVVRAAFASKIPIISAIGHETDFTLLDFVADKRAPTPTAAAEISVPVRRDLYATLRDINKRRFVALYNSFTQKEERYLLLKRSMPRFDRYIAFKEQACDDIIFKLRAAFKEYYSNKKFDLQQAVIKLVKPNSIIEQKNANLQLEVSKLNNFLLRFLQTRQHQLELMQKMLHGISYHNTLKRGFAIIRDEQDQIITTANVKRGKRLVAELKEGKLPLIAD